MSTDRQTPQLRHPRYEALSTSDGPLARGAIGRLCAAESCTTVLSRYNPSDCCSAHLGWQDTRKRQRI